MVRALISLLLTGLLAGNVLADANLPRSLQDVGFDQKLNEQLPLDLSFRDDTGKRVYLGEYFHDRPVILVLAYYKCTMLCNEVLNGLVRGLLDIPFTVGKDLEVVVVSFDPKEKPDLAAAKKEHYVQFYGRSQGGAGWHFLTGEAEAITQLAQAVGFRYHYDEQKKQYAHASGIMVLTPKGKIYRYFFDVRYDSLPNNPRNLRLTLVEASENRIGTIKDQFLLYCFHYDPIEGKYGPTIMNIVRLGGVLTILAVGCFLFVMWRRERRMATLPPVPGTSETMGREE
jgi:protein SCO1/2